MTIPKYITAKREIPKLFTGDESLTIADIAEVKEGRFNLGTIRRAVDELENDGVLKYAGKCNWTLNK